MTDEACMPDREPTWIDDRRNAQGLRTGDFSRERDETDDRALLADVAFNRHSMNDGEHVSPSDNATIQVGTDGIRVSLVQGIDEAAFKRTLSAATRATIGLDMTQPIDAEGDWEEMLKGGLQTALETQTIVFAVGGVSRTCTHQLVRSRRASFHQQSQRAGYMGDGPECRMPESIWKSVTARQTFFRSVMASWRAYRDICDMDISYQDARFVLPEGTTNFIMLEYPIREFLNVYAYRGCSMFQWEIVQVMRECRRVLVEAHPWIEPYVKISCEKTGPARVPIKDEDLIKALHVASNDSPEAVGRVMLGMPSGLSNPTLTVNANSKRTADAEVEHHCTFQGWESVEGQCDFPWAREEARTFKPSFHKIERKS